MAALSNSDSSHDRFGNLGGLPGSLELRTVKRGEIDTALRLLLSDRNGLADNQKVLDFLSLAIHRGINVNDLWVAVDTAVRWCLLPVVSPGRTVLLLTPNGTPTRPSAVAATALVDAVCRHFAGENVQLAQVLLDNSDPDLASPYFAGGFGRLAELIYLARTVSAPVDPRWPAGDFQLHQYGTQTHEHFARAIRSSYEASYDCPAIGGLRSIDDVIAGHQAAGEFDPMHWFALTEHAEPIAVLLMSRSGEGASMELVYLGLAPRARGRGIGDAMMRLAVDTVSRSKCRELCLAVDSTNTPALNLYYRHGLRRIAARLALVRNLASANESLAAGV